MTAVVVALAMLIPHGIDGEPWRSNLVADATQPAVRTGHGCDVNPLCTLPPDPWPDIPGTPTDATWDRIAACESNGRWDINTGNGYFGGVQFALSSWRAVGGDGYPHHASKDEQIYRADRLWLRQGWPAWPACSRKLGLR